MSFLISIARVNNNLADWNKFTPLTMRQFSDTDIISIEASTNAKTFVSINGTEKKTKIISLRIK
jgi:hypothetical protein